MRYLTLFSVRAKLESAWPLACLAYTVTAGAFSPVYAYIFLLLYTTPILLFRKPALRELKRTDMLIAVLVVLGGHFPVLRYASANHPSAPALVFILTGAVVEEMFFRGVLLQREGLLLQSFIFALTHLTLSDPFGLVRSSLLWPHYFLVGLTFGLIAEKRGWHLAALVHATYNAAAIAYSLPLQLEVVGALLVGDLVALILVKLYFHLLK